MGGSCFFGDIGKKQGAYEIIESCGVGKVSSWSRCGNQRTVGVWRATMWISLVKDMALRSMGSDHIISGLIKAVFV